MQRTAGSTGRAQPSEPSICFCGGQSADKILVVEGSDDERMIREPRVHDYPINLGLTREVKHVELAAANRFHVRQRGPNEVFDIVILGSAYRRDRLLEFICTLFPEISDQENAMHAVKCSLEGFRPI